MKLTLQSTEQLVEVVSARGRYAGTSGRVWIGETGAGVPVQCLIVRVAVAKSIGPEAHAAFETELQEHVPSPLPRAFDLRFFVD